MYLSEAKTKNSISLHIIEINVPLLDERLFVVA